ncbi:hypothetical protein P9112_003230 [Eukaryota sp. TZLM1-RC]
MTLVKSNVDFDDVVVVGCQSQSIVATDSTIDLETVLVRDSTATDGHFELTKTTLTMNNANFQDTTKVTGTNVDISDSNSNFDDLFVINNSELTLTTVDLSDTKFSNIIDTKTSTITITDFDIVHHESNTGSFINADDSTLDFTNVKTLGPVDSDGKVISGCANDEPLITLVKSNVDFDDVVVVGCQSQSIVATDSTIDLETVLVRDSTATDGHFELTKTTLTMNNANFQGLEGKVFNIKDTTKVTGTNVDISDSNSNSDDLIVIYNSDLTLTTVDLSNTKFSNIIDTKTSTITITDFDIVHHESNTGSFINTDDSTLDFTDVKTLGPVDSDGNVISGCANDEPLMTLVKSNVDFDDVVVVGCQSQSIVATDSTIDLETVLVRDSTATDGHFELTKTTLTMNNANFQGLEGKVFNIKDTTKVTGANVGISDSNSNSDNLIVINNSDLTLTTVDLSNTKFSNIIDTKTSTITITDFDIVHHESNSGSFINTDDSTLDFTNVKTLGPVDSDGKVISGCANDEPLITLVKSNVDFDDVVVVGCQSQSIVATDSTIDLETVLVRDSTATDGHFELTKTTLTMNNANFQGLEGKVFNIKDTTKVTGTNVDISDSNSNSDDLIVINNSELTLTTVDLSNTKFSNIIDTKTSTITITDFDIVHHESNTGSFINADDSTLDFTNVKTLGPVDSDCKVISGCANDEPLITLVKSNVDFDDVVVVGCQSQSIVATDSTIDLETVLVRDSTATDGHFELTKTNLTMNNANFQGLEGKVFNIKDTTKVTGTNVDISDSNSNSDDLIVINNSELTLTTVDLSNTKFSNIIDTKTSTITITDFDIVHHESNTGSFINADDSTLDFTNVKTLGPVDSDGKVISGCANDEPLITLVKSNVDFDDVVVVGCQSQSIVATDSTIDLETVLVRDSTATDGHFELTKTTLTMNNANFQGLEGKVFNIKDTTKVTGTNVDISDSNSNSDDLIVINNSDLTLTNVDLSNTKFSNIIDTQTSIITITDFDIVHHESNTGSFINADDSTLDFTNVKTLGPVDSDGKVISGCANDEPLITLVKSNVDFDDVVVVGCQSQSIVATDSTIDLETVLVRDSTATDGHFELTKTTLTMNNTNFERLEGEVLYITDASLVNGSNIILSEITSLDNFITSINKNSLLSLFSVLVKDSKTMHLLVSFDFTSFIDTFATHSSIVSASSFNLLNSTAIIDRYSVDYDYQSKHLITLSDSTVTLRNSIIVPQRSYTNNLIISTRSKFFINNVTTTSLFDLGSKFVFVDWIHSNPLIISTNSEFEIDDSIVTNSGASAVISSNSDLIFTGIKSDFLFKSSEFHKVHLSNDLPSFKFSGSKIDFDDVLIADSQVDNQTPSLPIFDCSQSHLSIVNSHFTKNDGVIFYVHKDSVFDLEQSEIINNQSPLSPIILEEVALGYVHGLNSFRNNRGLDGGCISVLNSLNFTCTRNMFSGSFATRDGGSLNVRSSRTISTARIADNSFVNNHAVRAGGAFYLNYRPYPKEEDLSNNFQDCQAYEWGDDVATDPRHIELEWVDPESIAYRRQLSVFVTDYYNVRAWVRSEYVDQLNLYPISDDVLLQGPPTTGRFSNWMLRTVITMRGVPGNYTLFVGLPGLEPAEISFRTGACPLGHGISGPQCVPCREGTRSSPNGNSTCINCPAGQWSREGSYDCNPCPIGSFRPDDRSPACQACPVGSIAPQVGSTDCQRCGYRQVNDHGRSECECISSYLAGSDSQGELECLPCPLGLACFGSDSTCVMPGYWPGTSQVLSANDTINVIENYYKCQHSGCLGSCADGLMPENMDDIGDLCDTNHGGLLCLECKDHSYMMAGKCTACGDAITNMVTLGISIVVLLFFIYCIIKEGAKMGLFFVVIRFLQQAVSITVMSNITIHSKLIPIYGALKTVFVDIWKTIPLMCLDLISRDYPIALFASFAIVFVFVIAVYIKKPKDPNTGYPSTIYTSEIVLVVILLFVPSLAHLTFGLFSCIPVNDTYVVEADASENIMKCFTIEWWTLAGAAILLSLITLLYLSILFNKKPPKDAVGQRPVEIHRYYGYRAMSYEKMFLAATVTITGLLWLVPTGLIRISATVVFVLAVVVFICKTNPFKDAKFNYASIGSCIVLVILLFQGLIIELSRFSRHFVWVSDTVGSFAVGLIPIIWTIVLLFMAFKGFITAPVVISATQSKVTYSTNPLMNPMLQASLAAKPINRGPSNPLARF